MAGFVLCSLLLSHAAAFFEAFFEQAFQFGGAGGGGQFHFEFGGGGGGHIAADQAPSEWPSGYPTSIDESKFGWVKGTEWLWSGWKNVRFHADGTFEAPSPECTPSHAVPKPCRWSSTGEKLFVLWGRAGVHWVRPLPAAATKRMEGVKEKDGSVVWMEFVTKFEEQHLWRLFGFASSEEFAASDQGELKKRYRRLTLELHPDKVGHGNTSAVEQFRRVTEAYEILNDPVKRFIYDLHGRPGLARLERGEFVKGDTRVAEIRVPLEVVYKGGEVEVEVGRRVVCVGGGGGCSRCPSEVQTVTRQVGAGFFVQQQVRVESQHFCRKSVEPEMVTIPRHVAEGTEIVLAAKGDQSPERIPGDVVFRIFSKPHATYRRVQEHMELVKPLRLSLTEALLGFERTLRLPDDEEVVVTASRVTQHGELFVFEGRGFGGDLRVAVEVVFPKKLTNAQKTIIGKFF